MDSYSGAFISQKGRLTNVHKHWALNLENSLHPRTLRRTHGGSSPHWCGSSLTTGPADQESLRGFPCQRSSFFAGLRHWVISLGSRISRGSRWDENITGLGSFCYSLCQKLPVARTLLFRDSFSSCVRSGYGYSLCSSFQL